MARAPISSLAIAGAWGYIGRAFLQAAAHLRLGTSVFDPGRPPRDLDLQGVAVFDREEDFFRQQADLFHLAVHPEHRDRGLRMLLQRNDQVPVWVLCEKPMALPQSPHDCARIVDAVERSPAVVLYDFPELFDPMTRRILDFLSGFDDVQITSITLQRSKDREDPGIARNEKRMVHIQYQESVHCLAFALYILAHQQGGWENVFAQGLTAQAQSRPYAPPNPALYPYVVDGRCEYQVRLGGAQIRGRTDFTRGAPWAKERTIAGTVDGRPFLIEADYLEGRKRLVIDGQPQPDAVHANSYVEVIRSLSRLRQDTPAAEVQSQILPHPRFARLTYQFSSVLWKSSWEREVIELSGLQDVLAFDAGFAAAAAQFAHY